jgi:hypothetical protein
LRWLARHNDVLINRAEITLDLIFKSRAAKEETLDCLHQQLVATVRKFGFLGQRSVVMTQVA